MPSDEELKAALIHAFDVMEQAQIPFIVLGSAAYQIKNDLPLQVPKITVGVMQNHAVKECTTLLQSIDPKVEMTQDGWNITQGSAKVVVKIITKKFHTLIDPDIHWYAFEPFKIPNPFNDYWDGPHFDI